MNDTTRRILALCEKHPHFFYWDISYQAPLTYEQLERYENLLHWPGFGANDGKMGLSLNGSLPWSKELIDRFIDRWEWSALSSFIIGDKVWYQGILEDYAHLINWHELSKNSGMRWTEENIDQFSHRIDWKEAACNQHFPWTKERLIEHQADIDVSSLSSSLNAPFYRYQSRAVEILPGGMAFLDRLAVVEKYEDRIDWTDLNWDWISGLTKNQFDFVVDYVLVLSKELMSS